MTQQFNVKVPANGTLDNIYVISGTQYEIPYTKVVTFEQYINREDYSTDAEYQQALKDDLRAKSTAYLAENSVPKVNYSVNTIPMQNVKLGDVVEVQDENIGVNILARVISYEYDCIMEKITNLEYGNFTKKLNELLPSIDSKIEKATFESEQTITTNYERAIKQATDIINNAMRQKAIQAAKRSTFASDPDAPEEQHGTITYTFVINQ